MRRACVLRDQDRWFSSRDGPTRRRDRRLCHAATAAWPESGARSGICRTRYPSDDGSNASHGSTTTCCGASRSHAPGGTEAIAWGCSAGPRSCERPTRTVANDPWIERGSSREVGDEAQGWPFAKWTAASSDSETTRMKPLASFCGDVRSIVMSDGSDPPTPFCAKRSTTSDGAESKCVTGTNVAGSKSEESEPDEAWKPKACARESDDGVPEAVTWSVEAPRGAEPPGGVRDAEPPGAPELADEGASRSTCATKRGADDSVLPDPRP